MKRKILFFTVLLVFCTTLFAACANINQAIFDNISEVYHGVYEGENGGTSAKIITGIREKEFVMDGKSGTMADFAVITVNPADGLKLSEGQKYAYSFTHNEKEYSGELSDDKMTGKPAAEIKANLGNGAEFVLTVSAGEEKVDLTMKSVMGTDIIPYTAALDLAKKEFKTEIEGLYSNGKLNCEIYIRYVAGTEKAEKDYYWYIAFLQSDKKFFAVLIDPITSTVLTKRS